MPTRSPGLSFSEIHAKHVDAQRVTTRCNQPGCRWRRTTSLARSRDLFAEHLKADHPDVHARTLAKKKQTTSATEQKKEQGLCRRDGCDNEQAGPKKGPHAHLCHACIAEQRDNAKRSRLEGKAKPNGTPPPDPEVMLEQLRRFHAEHGRTPTATELDHNDRLPTRHSLAKAFGGLIPALDLAGIPRPELFRGAAA